MSAFERARNKVAKAINEFLTKDTKIEPNTTDDEVEVIDGKAFHYKTYDMSPVYHQGQDTLSCSIVDIHGKKQTVEKTFEGKGVINTVAIFQTKEMFGMTDVIGGVFGYKENK